MSATSYSQSNSLQKEERLSRQSTISDLFEKGHTFSIRPLRVLWITCSLPTDAPAQVLVTVSRKRFPNAVTRNRIKRKMREVYRIHKHPLYTFFSEQGTQCAIGLVYIAQQEVAYQKIENATKKSLQRLINDYEQMDS